MDGACRIREVYGTRIHIFKRKNQKEKVHLADPGVSEWIILKCKGMIVGLATVLILLRMEIIGGLL